MPASGDDRAAGTCTGPAATAVDSSQSRQWQASSDPPVLADGSCAYCGKPRRLEGVKPLYRKHAAEDPFCTTACAREWHGVTVSPNVPRGRRAYVSKLAETG